MRRLRCSPTSASPLPPPGPSEEYRSSTKWCRWPRDPQPDTQLVTRSHRFASALAALSVPPLSAALAGPRRTKEAPKEVSLSKVLAGEDLRAKNVRVRSPPSTPESGLMLTRLLLAHSAT